MVFFLILIILVCVLLTLVVLIQNPKGGGIAANFTAPNQIMGANRSTDVVEKATWILAVALIVLSLASNFARPGSQQEETAIESKLDLENANTGGLAGGGQQSLDTAKK
jgi:preprotein translocase subunit SecG